MTTYCEYCAAHPEDRYNKTYHDTEYGFPLDDDNLLFERLILEINQAGLSWITILKKRDSYGELEMTRLLSDAGIIRNKLKVNAAIFNARRILEIQSEFGSFKRWLDENHPRGKEEWVRLFKKNFKFVGGEIVGEFLMSTGYLPGAHDEDCPVFSQVAKLKPAWMR